ncbi:HNH endonuclease [Aurantimonas sp. A2-1-M11]|uniref:HNH endonuclease n=1 Tax=Aurantimonas sp. A2-1-M11 TaxID=3113712 RepID=UPI002F9343DC
MFPVFSGVTVANGLPVTVCSRAEPVRQPRGRGAGSNPACDFHEGESSSFSNPGEGFLHMPARVFASPDIDLSYFAYDPVTGKVRYAMSRGRAQAGDEVGVVNQHGYRHSTIEGQYVAVHRLAWRLHYGEWQMHQIDHRDKEKTNNRIDNLRKADDSQNRVNTGSLGNLTGYKGVTFDERAIARPYRALIQWRGRRRFIGCFDTAEEAAAAYDREATRLHRDFADLNGVVVEKPTTKKRNATGLQGVSKVKSGSKTVWKAMIFHGGKHVYLGKYRSEETAARDYDLVALELKDGAKTNFFTSRLFKLMGEAEEMRKLLIKTDYRAKLAA